jgi:hypothetical protein
LNFFIKANDFCEEFAVEIEKHQLDAGNCRIRNRKASLSDSEIITLLIAFHSGHFTNLKHFYLQCICIYYQDYFPDLVYNRFVELQKRVAVPMMLFLKQHCLGKSRGTNFIDSTRIRVCHNRRIHNHKVFSGVAEPGQCSIGWFYGFKLHLIINDRGEILSFYLTKGNVDDRNVKLVTAMTQEVFGKLFGDKGYISKALSDLLWGNGIPMITKPAKT